MHRLDYFKQLATRLFPSDMDDAEFLKYLIELDKWDDNRTKEASEDGSLSD
jgi:hypothetical protein